MILLFQVWSVASAFRHGRGEKGNRSGLDLRVSCVLCTGDLKRLFRAQAVASAYAAQQNGRMTLHISHYTS